MKKIIISNCDSIYNPYYNGGGAKAVHEIAKRLVREYKVKILTSSFNGSKDLVVDDVMYEFIGSDILGARLSQILFQFAMAIKSRTEKYDLWIEGSTPPFTFSLLPLIAKGKVVCWVHMLAGLDMSRKYKLPFTIYERLLSKGYKNFIVLSDWTKNRIVSEYNNAKANIGVIPNGTSGTFEHKPSEGSYVLYLGRIEINQKGLDLLVEAFKKVSKKEFTKLIIAGNGPDNEQIKLKELVVKNNLTNFVKIVGRVDGKRKDRIYSNCLAFLLPSRFDTYPLTILEAFSYSKPVVIFDLPQLSWVPDSASIKISLFDTNKYALAIERLVTDKPLRRKKGKAAYEFVKERTWDNIYKKFEQYIKEI
jgi:glycosyltransferase involved in cell wall biosynthesis